MGYLNTRKINNYSFNKRKLNFTTGPLHSGKVQVSLKNSTEKKYFLLVTICFRLKIAFA
jgi:hypothetical protein